MKNLKQLWLLIASILKGKDLRLFSERQEALVILRRISGAKRTRYAPKLGEQVVVETGYQSLESFIEALKIFNEIVAQENDIIPTNLCDIRLVPVVLDNMFVSRTGGYLKAETADEFIEQAIRLCEQMESTEELETGPQAYNNRVLARVYTSIKNVSAGLSESLI